MSALIVILLLAFFAFIVFTQVQARKHSTFHTPLGKIQAQEVIDRTFGAMWTRTSGPGQVNVKPKLRSHAPTISISVEAGAQGGSDVEIWMSAWRTRYGIAAHAQLVWRKKRALTSALNGAPSGSVGSAITPQTPSAAAGPAKATSSAPASRPAAQTTAVSNNRSDSPVVAAVHGTDTNFVVRTKRRPSEVAAALGAAIQSTQPGSATHLMLGPPRATMWAHLQELSSGETLMTLSLMTAHNRDMDYVSEGIRAPLENIVAPSLDATVTMVDGHGVPGQLQQDLVRGRVVPVAELNA